MQDEQAALARELTALEAARVVEAQQVDRPRSALDDLEAQAARARDLEAMTAARRARDQAAEAEQAARAERDAKVAAMPKSLSRDLAAAVLGLPGSETYWGNILIAQAELRGTIEYGSPLRIDGRVDGACQAPVIMVSQGAAVTGTIAAETIVLLGPVCGTIVGRHVVITASASVEGDLVYQTLSLDQAAQCDLRFSRLPAGADPVLVAFPGTEMSRAA
jgi:cytoskeletal protein CcmA (bactofilin family)